MLRGGSELEKPENIGQQIRVDLHVHSRCSEAPTDWYMQWCRMAESYSDPGIACQKALRAGMAFFTLTDHNSIDGCLALRERYGELIINGVESTVSFPEDDCRIHLLIYGISERQFTEIQRLRKDIYQLRDFIREQDLAHSVAHATYGVQGKSLTSAHLEKLIILFNNFEAMNGARNKTDNLTWLAILENLTPEILHELQKKHGLNPFDNEPWKKGFTGGSDDHAGIFIGRTYTQALANTPEEFLRAIKTKKTNSGGRHGDYQSLVYSIFKIIHDSSYSKDGMALSSLLSGLTEKVFDEKPLGLVNRFRIRRLKARAGKKRDEIYRSFHDLAQGIKVQEFQSPDDAIQFIDSKISCVSDAFMRYLLTSLEKDLSAAGLLRLVRNIGAFIPGLLIMLPFLLTLKHMHENRAVVERLSSNLGVENPGAKHRILWFTDTINDLNGVSETLREIGWICDKLGYDLKIMASFPEDTQTQGMPPNVINLGSIHNFSLPYYDHYIFNIPSLLGSLKEIYRLDPDRIYISTPGPVGLLGLLAAKLMHVKTTGFFHTDFSLQAREIAQDRSVSEMLESYTKWFYSKMDEIMVPTSVYLTLLKSRGFEPGKLKIFERGIADNFLLSDQTKNDYSLNDLPIGEGIIFLYAGRVSRDKGLDLLMEIYEVVAARRADTQLIIAGDGPYLPELKKRHIKAGKVFFTGRINRDRLAEIYRRSHLFLFPSATDTFGRVVLEAQACGLPVVVSDAGGPRELILDGKTGLVAKAGDRADWEDKIERVLNMMEHSPLLYQKMKENAHTHVTKNYIWETALNSIMGEIPQYERTIEKKIA